MDYQRIPISPDFEISVESSDRLQGILSPEDRQRIEQIWSEEKARRGEALFDGQVFNYYKLEKDRLSGEFINYKTYLASTRDPVLAKKLKVQTIGITGLTTSGVNVLIGQRAAHVTLYPNYYEFAPSGIIDPSSLDFDHIDIQRQIISELIEETRVSEKDVISVVPQAIVKCLKTGDLEVAVKIELASFLGDHPLVGTDEYPRLIWIDNYDLPNFMNRHHDQFVPISAQLFHYV